MRKFQSTVPLTDTLLLRINVRHLFFETHILGRTDDFGDEGQTINSYDPKLTLYIY